MFRSMQVTRSIAAALLLVIAMIPIACGEDADDAAETATIEPAIPEPNVDIEDDPALTQTVDPGEDRSPYEGGPLEEDEVIGGDDDQQPPPDQNPND